MKIEDGYAVLVTGAGSGIGRALAMEFARRGAGVSVVDFSEKNGRETVQNIRQQAEELNLPERTQAHFFKCNVSSAKELSFAFSEHMRIFGRLDVCVNNAGVGEKKWFLEDVAEESGDHWRRVVEINLHAVIEGTRLAIGAMKSNQSGGGVIINVASAAGLYPSAGGPIYSASKGGVVLFTRSLSHLSKSGVRVNALCPEYIDTPLVSQVSGQAKKHLPGVIQSLGGYIPMEKIVDCTFELIEDETKSGACLWITNRYGAQYWPTEEEKLRYSLSQTTTPSQKRQNPSGGRHEQLLPKHVKKIIVHTLSPNFRAATKIVQLPMKFPLPHDKILVKYLYTGVNASDINYSAGRYFGSPESAKKRLPFDAGFEGVGTVAAVGQNVKNFKFGDSVATLSYGAFSDYALVDAKSALPVSSHSPQVVALLTSGLTASIALEQAGKMGSGQTVLVTAAAGGTGQFAVQLAKLAGNRVVATCGGAEKVKLLTSLGVDRVIDYRSEDVAQVLTAEFPDGVDVIYESVGGKMFDHAVASLARFGRCVVIGMMSQYTNGDSGKWSPSVSNGLMEKLLWKSQTVTGFFLLHYTSLWKRHLAKLYSLYEAGHLQVAMDPKEFCGLEEVPDAIKYLHSGKSVGKVVVKINHSSAQQSRL